MRIHHNEHLGFGSFYLLATVDCIRVNMAAQISLKHPAFDGFRYIPEVKHVDHKAISFVSFGRISILFSARHIFNLCICDMFLSVWIPCMHQESSWIPQN